MAIKTIGATGDYPSPQLWEASLPATLAEPETVKIFNESFAALTDVQKTFDINVATSATNFITIESNGGDQDFAADELTAPVFSFGRGGTFGLITVRNGCDHLKIKGLTAGITNVATNFLIDVRGSFASDTFLDIDNCYSYPNGGAGGIILKSAAKGTMTNSIVVTNNSAGLMMATDYDYIGNTIVGNYDGAASSGAAAVRFNTTAGAITDKIAAFNFGPTGGWMCYLNKAPIFTDNASSDGSGNTGFQNLALLDQYTDPINHDWSFKVGNSIEGVASGGADIGVVLPSGGGGISITGATANYNYTGISGSVDLTGEIIVTGSTANYNYTGITGTIDLTALITVTGQTANYNYTAIDGVIDLTGEVIVTGSTANYNYSGIAGAIEIGAEIIVVGQTASYNYAGINGDVDLTALITVVGQTANYDYTGIAADVIIQGAIIVTGNTANYDYLGVNATIKLQGPIVVNPRNIIMVKKSSTVIKVKRNSTKKVVKRNSHTIQVR